MVMPGIASPRSPVASTFVAPWAPSSSATVAPSPPNTAVTSPPRLRALASSSRVIVFTLPSTASAKTQTFETAISDHLQVLEEGHDLGVALAVVFDDLAGLAL